MTHTSIFPRLLILLAILGLSFTVEAQNVPEGMKKVAAVEGITEYQMDNGLRVLLFPDQSQQTITVNVTYLVGSRHEGIGETGMAHLLEHLVFKGTPDHPNIPQELTEHGARPNGTTWYDRTNYFETFNATDENLEWALDMEADRMVNSFIAKKDLDSEMTVVRNEYESGENSPTGVLMKRTMGAAYQWHNYGKSTIGARSDLENVPIERLQAFYKKYYQPDNAVLTVAGKIDVDKTLALIKDNFGSIKRPDRKNFYPTYTKEPTQDGERFVELKRVGDVQALSVMYHTPPGSHREYASIAVLDEILTSEPSGRLYTALVEPGKASYVWSFAPGLKEGAFIYIGVDVRKDKSLEEAKETLLTTLDELKDNPPTKEEVERAKKRILKNWDLSYNNSGAIGRTLSEYIAQGDWRLIYLLRDRVEAVTAENVAEVAEKYFKPGNRTVGQFIPVDDTPDRAEIPDAPDVAKLVETYTGREEVAQGEAFDPSPSNIESRTSRDEIKNTIEYALLPKKTRGESVYAMMTFRYGTEKSLQDKDEVAGFMTSMFDRGSANMSRQEFQDKLDELNARISIFGGSSSTSVRIETERKNLPEVIDLVAEALKNPAFDEKEFESLKQEQLSSLEEQMSEPSAIAQRRMGQLFSPHKKGDIRYVKTMEEEKADMEKVTLEQVKEFYKNHVGATDATIAVVGDFDEKEVKQRIENNFGTWRSPGKYVRISRPYIANKVANENIETPDKANAMFFAGVNFKMKDDNPDYAALNLGNYMLGGGFLNSRLATRIRQEEGLSYGVGSFFNASSREESGYFGSYAIYAPENVERLEKVYREEIQRMLKEGFTAEELEAAKSGWLQNRTISRSQDGSLASTLNSYLDLDRDLMWQEKLERQVEKLTVDEVNRAMRKYIDLDKMFFVKAGDFAKAKKDNVKKP